MDYDGLPGEGKTSKARELIAHQERRKKVDELVNAVRRERPETLQPDTGNRYANAVRHWLSDIKNFSRTVAKKPLRSYQIEPAEAILDSILHGRGMTFAVEMSRQAGKNELAAQLEAYLLNLYSRRGGSGIKASPTFKPQTQNSILRLEDRLDNVWNAGRWRKREGYIFQIGKARFFFFSAEPTANVVGATATMLLEADESQEIGKTKWYKEFVPMGASANTTTVHWGTAWTKNTLLAETIQDLKRQERKDGRRRVFIYDADRVGAEVPAYATYIAKQIDRLGRNHPLIKSQYFLEEIDAQGGLFPPMRRALMRGDHQRRHEPEPGKRYALLIDVAGEDEAAGDPLERMMLENPKRDATALTVVEVEIEYGRQPRYRTVDRKLRLGVKHTTLHSQILALAQQWNAMFVVIDATGIGAGLASFLVKALGDKVIPVVFSSKVKSDLGWNFVGIVETGRYADYQDDSEPDTRQFWYEVENCQYQVRDGPGKLMSWGVWDSIAYDGLIAYGHDDLIVGAALTAILDDLDWPSTGESAVVQQPDVLDEIDASDW